MRELWQSWLHSGIWMTKHPIGHVFRGHQKISLSDLFRTIVNATVFHIADTKESLTASGAKSYLSIRFQVKL